MPTQVQMDNGPAMAVVVGCFADDLAAVVHVGKVQGAERPSGSLGNNGGEIMQCAL